MTYRTDRLTAEEISRRLAGSAETLARRLFPNAYRDGQHLRVGSLAGEKGQSLCIDISGPHKGRWTEFAKKKAAAGPTSGDMLDLIAHVECGGDLKAAVRWAVRWLGEDRQAPAPLPIAHRPTPDDDTEREQRSEAAKKIWAQAQPAAGTLVEKYLRSRGITIPVPLSLRYHGYAKHWPTGLALPAMVAGIQSPAGEVVAVHLTFLKADGSGKAGVNKNKLMFGPCRTGAVRLAKPAPELVTGEGLESCLSVMQATGLPTWAALSTSGLKSVILPPETTSLLIAADPDEPGEDAAQAAAARFVAEGRKVRIMHSPVAGLDWNDILQLPGNVAMFPRKEAAHV